MNNICVILLAGLFFHHCACTVWTHLSLCVWACLRVCVLVSVVTGAVQNVCAQCTTCLASALAPGDRSYQDNMVLLTEIGFLSESLVEEYKLKGKRGRERERGTDSDKPFPCLCLCYYSYVWYLCLLGLRDHACFTVLHPLWKNSHLQSSCTTVFTEYWVIWHFENMSPSLIQWLLAWKQGSNWILLLVMLLTPVMENGGLNQFFFINYILYFIIYTYFIIMNIVMD